jgi:dihydroceramide fatty acyl 2-hydroxylase
MRVLGLILLGVVWWTLLEYLLHRFAFHKKGKYLGKRHLAHHAKLDKRRLAVAPWQSMVGGSLLNAAVFVAVFGWAPGGALMAGMLGGYAAYEWIHYSTHYLRAYHLAHHHKSPKTRFGVTSPLWDYVFGTHETVARGARRE